MKDGSERAWRQWAVALVLLVGLAGGLVACQGDWKETTAWLVGETVEKGKNVASGIKEGIEEGRKRGESWDDARIVTDLETLRAYGILRVHRVKTGDAAGTSKVVLAVINETERPLRLTGMNLLSFDKEGFAQDVSETPGDVTVPRSAKRRITFEVPISPEEVAKIRIWKTDMPVPEEALSGPKHGKKKIERRRSSDE